jgi:L-alanine-DL-glutamate epimerase-like enolase superfamily enzyme
MAFTHYEGSDRMRITEIELFPVQTPREMDSITPHIIVRILTDEGVTGVGEMSDLDHLSKMPDVEVMSQDLNADLGSVDVYDMPTIDRQVRKLGSIFGAGIDMAILDIKGKALDVPVYKLLGGPYRDRFEICYPIFGCPDQKAEEENVQRVGRIMKLHGFDLFRFYPGRHVEGAEMFLKGVRDTYGDRVRFKSLDMSGAYEPDEAIEVINRFEQYGFMLVESPCRDIDGKARVRAAVNLPISEHTGGFSHALELAQKGAVDIFNIAVVSAGVRQAQKIFALAEAFGIKTLIGTTQELSIGTAAQAHLGASVPNLDFPSDAAGARLYTKDVVKERIQYEDGYLIVPEGPGLGMEIDEEKLAEVAASFGG